MMHHVQCKIFTDASNEGISFVFRVKQSQVRITWTAWSQRWRQRVAANSRYLSVD